MGPENGVILGLFKSVSKALSVTYTHLKNTVCLQVDQEVLIYVGKAQGTVEKACSFSDLSVCVKVECGFP